MEIAFWHLALVLGLIAWMTCTFLRVVAARVHHLREQVIAELMAAHEAEDVQEVTEAGTEEATVAAVVNVPGNGVKKTAMAGNGQAATRARRPSRS